MSVLFEKLISSMVASGDARILVQHPEIKDYASYSQVDGILYELVDSHMQSYGKIPSKAVIEEEFGQPLQKADEPAAFYLDKLKPNHIRKTLQAAVTDAQLHFADDPERALKSIEKAVYSLRMAKEGASMIDFREAGPRILKHLASKVSGEGFHALGWPTYDKMSGGITAGDFITVVGFSGTGKTQLLLSRAFYLWQQKMKVLFVSNEMNLDAILERSAALHSKVPADFFKHGLFPNVGPVNFKQKVTKWLSEAAKSDTPFWFIDGNLAVTRDDLHRLCSQLQPDVMFVDGAYLLGGTGYDKRWTLIAENASFMKQVISTRMGIPVVASYQFTRDATKEKDKKKGAFSTLPGLGDIAGSQEIGNLSSAVFGLFQDDTPETILRRKIEIIKGRNGESGRFYVNWNWVTMSFDEVSDDSKEQVDIT